VQFFETHDRGRYWKQMPEVQFEPSMSTLRVGDGAAHDGFKARMAHGVRA